MRDSDSPRIVSDTWDKVSMVFLRLMDTLLLRNPERTAVGGMLGLTIHGIVTALRPAMASRGLGSIEWWASLSVGIVIVHLPFVVSSVRRKPLINDEVEGLIKLIESTNMSESEKRAAYREVVNKCIAEFSLSGTERIRRVIKSETHKRRRTVETESSEVLPVIPEPE